MGPRNAVLGGGDACELRHLGPSVELPMGPRNAVLGGGDACEHCHWGLRWSSLWGRETCEGCADMGVDDDGDNGDDDDDDGDDADDGDDDDHDDDDDDDDDSDHGLNQIGTKMRMIPGE